ncbi:hypothetical protein [Salinicoccus albus]|uniref:hypothetical protein n=1 Tax=Salinicoccus albus TaxID=418756 RepID=UPI000368B65B|nr:hypothetical protein [Salinicoccus albus]
MAFFKYLTWDNRHMNLRYIQDEYDGSMKITNVYTEDDASGNMEDINKKYGSRLRDAQRAINANRLGMLLIYSFLVLMPAIVLSVIQSNLLLLGGIIIFTIFVYFIVEAVNQVVINRLLYHMDKELHGSTG